ncbi:MAG TPA: YciI family protein [Polyangiaceae bacterium]|nr:YciI family protein [Polyangiaceae bacterium]
MNQYLLSVYGVEGEALPSPEVIQKMYADVDALNKVIQREGAWVFGGGLHPASSATVVRAKNDEILFTDGPFSEAKEQIGGFWVIKCKDLDAALKWASKATVACGRPVEVRPFQEPAA